MQTDSEVMEEESMSMHTVAVMGLGVRGKIHLHGLLQNPEYYKVVGLCDIDTVKMQAVA